ncbi:MAG: hypothetical protein ACKPKO_06690, partial [Candidatus Fonsibacter sp.]
AGSFEASAALAEQARDTRAYLHQAQAEQRAPWIPSTSTPIDLQQKAQAWETIKQQRIQWSQLTPKERRQQILPHNTHDPFDLIHQDGGMVDLWLMDDQTIICDPALINTIIDAVDRACAAPTRGGIRNRTKTHVILYATP